MKNPKRFFLGFWNLIFINSLTPLCKARFSAINYLKLLLDSYLSRTAAHTTSNLIESIKSIKANYSFAQVFEFYAKTSSICGLQGAKLVEIVENTEKCERLN